MPDYIIRQTPAANVTVISSPNQIVIQQPQPVTVCLSTGGTSYVLLPATNATLGGVKVGANLTVDANGVLAATAAAYTLPVATNGTLGGVKVGANLTIDANGVLNGQSSLWGSITGAPNITTGNCGTINIYGGVATSGVQANISLSTFFQVSTGSNLVFAGENANLVFGGDANMTTIDSSQYSMVFRSPTGYRRLSLGHQGSPNPFTTQGVYMSDVNSDASGARLDRMQAGFFYSKFCMNLEHYESSTVNGTLGATITQVLINSGHVELRNTTGLTAYSVLTRAQNDLRYARVLPPRGNGT